MGWFRRRQFLAAVGTTAFAGPFVCLGQQTPKVSRIGVLSQDSSAALIARQQREFLYDSLSRAGYKTGKNIVIEWRFAEGKVEQLAQLANELVRSNVDVIIAVSSVEATLAAKTAARNKPVVMHYFPGDPVQLDVVATLARPNSNVTGTMYADASEIFAKQYNLLKEAAPATVRVAALFDRTVPHLFDQARFTEQLNALGMVMTEFPISHSEETPAALQRIAALKPDALFVNTTAAVRVRLTEIVTFAIHRKLITMSNGLSGVREGLLLYYGPHVSHVWDRTVSFVDRILRGAPPKDLPVEQPAKYEFVFNAKTARAIGYALPPALLLRVDRILE